MAKDMRQPFESAAIPIINDRAQIDAVREQLELAAEGDVPLMLFLDRLRTIEIVRILDDTPEDSACVERSSRTVEGVPYHRACRPKR